LWGRNAALLPAGLVHIPASAAAELPGATVKGVAWKAGIPCVEAMVGFETKRGRPVPAYDGVVVAAADAPRVLQALAVREQAGILSSIQERRGEVQERWSLLVRKALVRSRIGGVYAAKGAALPSLASSAAARFGAGAGALRPEGEARTSSVPLTSLVLAGEADSSALESQAAASKGRQRGAKATGGARHKATSGGGSAAHPFTAGAAPSGRDRALDTDATDGDEATSERHSDLPPAVSTVGADPPSASAVGGGGVEDAACVEGEGVSMDMLPAAAAATAQPSTAGGSSSRRVFGADADDDD